jgi:hypothetical protein
MLPSDEYDAFLEFLVWFYFAVMGYYDNIPEPSRADPQSHQ